MEKNFKAVIPASLEKGDDGQWRVYGLASSSDRDQQGEIIIQDGIDLSPVEQGKGLINFDHKKGPENIVGVIDKFNKSKEGLYLGGYLFKNHSRAKALHEIMSSLQKGDAGRIGMSVEGKIMERDSDDGRVIKKCKINAVALTFNPVNSGTYANLVKSLSGSEVEFDSTEDNLINENPENSAAQPVFTADQVVAMLEKALGTGSPAGKAPGELSGGEALKQEELDSSCKKCEKAKCECPGLKKGNAEFYKSQMKRLLESLQELHPESSRSELWEAVKDRLNTRFPEILD